MGRHKKEPYIYTRDDRPGLWAFISRDRRNIPLQAVDRDEALKELARLVYEHVQTEAVKPDKEISFADLCDVALKRAGARQTANYTRSIDRNLRRIRTFLATKGITSIRKIDADTVQQYIQWRIPSPHDEQAWKERRKPVSTSRVNHELYSWKYVFKVASDRHDKKHYMVSREALEMFPKLREVDVIPHQEGLTQADLDAFLSVASIFHPLYRSAIGTGMRDGELRHLSRADIREKSVRVSSKPPGFCKCCPNGWKIKGWHEREIPITECTKKALHDLVDLLEAGSIPEIKTVWKEIQRISIAAKLVRHVSMQEFRRAYGSHLLSKGIKLQVVSKLMGHRDVLTTMRYLRVVDEMPTADELPF